MIFNNTTRSNSNINKSNRRSSNNPKTVKSLPSIRRQHPTTFSTTAATTTSLALTRSWPRPFSFINWPHLESRRRSLPAPDPRRLLRLRASPSTNCRLPVSTIKAASSKPQSHQTQNQSSTTTTSSTEAHGCPSSINSPIN